MRQTRGPWKTEENKNFKNEKVVFSKKKCVTKKLNI